MPLPPKERRFVSEYVKDQNATAAAKRSGYSVKTADVQGPRLLGKVRVRAAVDAELAKIHEKAGITQERILNALLGIAEMDPINLFERDGTMKKLTDMTPEARKAISGLESDDLDGKVRKVRFADKIRALELLGKNLKMFVDRKEHSGPDGGPIPLPPSRVDMKSFSKEQLEKIIEKL